MTAGFLVVDKPAGVTSHDVVARVRRATGIKKAGHAGTLDPMATGVVIVAVGRVTRLIRYFQDLEKEYLATAMFGVATDSLDADGQVVEAIAMTVTRADLETVLPRFLGGIQQIPPMVSALKQDGRRLYELAREGREVERAARTVFIHELELVSVGTGPHPLVSFRVVCGKGTYIRSLADDLARALGGFAHLTALRRTRTGPLTEKDAVSLDELGGWRDHLVDPSLALSFLPRVVVDGEGARRVGTGRSIPITPDVTGVVRVVDGDGTLLGVYASDGTVAQPEVVLG